MMEKEIINVQRIFSNIFNFYDYTSDELSELHERDCNEFTPICLNEMQGWKFSKRALCYSFFMFLEFVFEDGKYVNKYITAKANDREKQYYISMQQEIDGDFEKHCRRLKTHQLKTFSLFELENKYISSLAFFELYYSSLPKFKLAKFCYITDKDEDHILKIRVQNNIKDLFIRLDELFPKETKRFMKIFDNRISEYLVSKYMGDEFGEDISTPNYSLLTYESEPVFELFFASKASFMVFRNVILPHNGDKISHVELWLIFDFFRQHKLRFQGRNISGTPMGSSKEQKKFIKAINPFFKKKYREDIRIDNTTPAANKKYPITDKLDNEYLEVRDKVKEINK